MSYPDPAEFNRACLSLQSITGQVSASITHEIKNQLAVIKEQAGLLNDLALMASKTDGMDPKRVESLCGRMTERARQADEIVKRFNRFAHASDEEFKELDAHESMQLMVQIYRRLADKKPVQLILGEAPQNPLRLTARPLFYLAALFACLDLAVNAAGDGGTLSIRLEAPEGEIRYSFGWTGGGEAGDMPHAELLAVLGMRIIERSGNSMVLQVPRAHGSEGEKTAPCKPAGHQKNNEP